MSLPSNTGRRTTRSGKPLQKANRESKEVFTTPMKENEKTSAATKSSSPTTPSEKAICSISICQNSIKLRNNFLEESVESLIGKINTACETFSDSMTQAESLGLNPTYL